MAIVKVWNLALSKTVFMPFLLFEVGRSMFNVHLPTKQVWNEKNLNRER
jgi:hypothetical protein